MSQTLSDRAFWIGTAEDAIDLLVDTRSLGYDHRISQSIGVSALEWFGNPQNPHRTAEQRIEWAIGEVLDRHSWRELEANIGAIHTGLTRVRTAVAIAFASKTFRNEGTARWVAYATRPAEFATIR